MAQVIAVPAERVFPLPDTVSFEAGAGLLFNDLTVHFALTERGRLATGETVLVHGAAGVSAPRRCGWRPPRRRPDHRGGQHAGQSRHRQGGRRHRCGDGRRVQGRGARADRRTRSGHRG
ncbi:quinone reductase [Mycobacterium xenopi 3993]|nr:quinone reductase [Mycobacterium xenopi 3993]